MIYAMAEVDDAHKLSSGHPIEETYANYANGLKDLANRARKEMVNSGKIAYSASANKVYHAEVESLNSKLNIASSNAPKERTAQTMANVKIASIKKEYPDISKGEVKKISQRALTQARTSVGAHREPIKFTDREWEAIQAGAISPSKLEQITKYVDSDNLKKYATPRTTTQLSDAKISKIKAMKNSGYSISEIADSLGISSSSVSKYLK